MPAKILGEAGKRPNMQRCPIIGADLRLDVYAEKVLQEKRAPVGILGRRFTSWLLLRYDR